MKNLFIYMLLSMLIVSVNVSAASTLDELATRFGHETESGDYSNAMKTATEVVELLIMKGDINNACKFSDKIINATHPSIARRGYYLKSLCWKAAYEINQDKSLLIKSGASLLNATQSDEAIALTSLLMEKYGGDPEVFSELVVHEMEAQTTDRTLQSSYSHIKNGRWELVKMYIDGGTVSVNDKLSGDGSTMLHMAIWFGENEVVKEMIETYGANINAIDKEGDTPLGYAKHKNNSEIVKYLEKQGAR